MDLQPADAVRGLITRERRRFTWKSRLGRYGTIAAIGLGVIASHYSADVNANISMESQSAARILERGAPLDESADDSALVFLTGVGTNNADTFAKYQRVAFQQVVDGYVWSVDYDNAALDPEAIGEAIREKAQRDGVSRVSIIGRSAGGIVGTQVVEYLLQHSSLTIDLLALESVPDGLDGVRPDNIRSMEIAEYLTLIPGAQHSTYLRVGLELWLRKAQYGLDPVKFAHTFTEVNDSVAEGRLPGSWLVVDQVLAISNARLEQRLAAIGEAGADRQRPVVLYLGTAAPGYDTQVNDLVSGRNICGYAEEAGLHCLDYDVPGAVHSRPEVATDAYERITAFAAPVIERWIAEDAARLSLQRFAIPTRVGVR